MKQSVAADAGLMTTNSPWSSTERNGKAIDVTTAASSVARDVRDPQRQHSRRSTDFNTDNSSTVWPRSASASSWYAPGTGSMREI